MWWLFLAVTAVFAIIAWVDFQPLRKKGEKKDKIAFFTVLVLAYVTCSLQVLDILPWHPVRWMINTFQPVTERVVR
jgi:hypothetical protein